MSTISFFNTDHAEHTDFHQIFSYTPQNELMFLTQINDSVVPHMNEDQLSNYLIHMGYHILTQKFVQSKEVSNIGFVMVHGPHKGYIALYTDIEFHVRKYQTYCN